MRVSKRPSLLALFAPSAWPFIAALLLCATVAGCGGRDKTGAQAPGEPGEEATAGGEQGLVSPTDQQYDGYEPDKDKSQAAAKSTQKKTQKKETNPWGAPEAETGRALPKRPKINAAAQSALKEGEKRAMIFEPLRAERAFKKALQEDGRAYQAAYNLGVMADRKGGEKKALDWYRKSLGLQADYEKAAQGIVNIYLRRGSKQQALSFIEPLAKKWERNLHLQAIYADVLAKNGRLDQAEEAARKALRRDERFVPAMISLIKTSLLRDRKELAESVLKQALQIDDKNAELHFLQGQMYEEQERTADALRSYEKAVKLRPDYAEALVALGIQYLAGGNYKQALSQFEKAVKLLPKMAAVHLNLGDAYRANKQWKKAKSSFQTALKLQSNLPEAHFNMGLMYMAAGSQFPGLDNIKAYTYAINEFTAYRSQMGPKLPRDDISTSYLEDLRRSIERENKRIEREKAAKQREKERAARAAETAKEKK
jgi:tetratricopeptide (TPR) repeat protein